MNFIYGLIDPRTLLIRYIGLATNVNRPFSHRSCLKSNWSGDITHKTNWIQELDSVGHSYDICILQSCELSDELFAAEIWWIAYGRSCGWPLTNGTDGGQGHLNPTPEARAKLSAAHKGHTRLRGYKHPPEFSATMSEAMIGNKNALGTIHSQEFRDKISDSRRGMKFSEAHRANLAIAQKKRYLENPATDERRKVVSAQMLGNKHASGSAGWSTRRRRARLREIAERIIAEFIARVQLKREMMGLR